jgi:hypothetical protein
MLLGDSLSHGFQSGAVYNTDTSWTATVAYELGKLDEYRYPGLRRSRGLPLNIELLLRRLEEQYGSTFSLWEVPFAFFTARDFMDAVEDYWEQGPGLFPLNIKPLRPRPRRLRVGPP